LEEKQQVYTKAPSGGPLVQHALVAMLEFYRQGKISLEKIVEKMCHNPARIFKIEKRGYIQEDFYADLVLVDLNENTVVEKDNILFKCKWSPFEGTTFHSAITHTFVNGNLVFEQGRIEEQPRGKRLVFNR